MIVIPLNSKGLGPSPSLSSFTFLFSFFFVYLQTRIDKERTKTNKQANKYRKRNNEKRIGTFSQWLRRNYILDLVIRNPQIIIFCKGIVD